MAAARENLQGKTDALAAQQVRLAELQQQNASISANRREMEQELARLRARRRTANPGSAPAGTSGATLLSAALRDPAQREMLRQALLDGFRNRLAPLFKTLNLDDQARDKLVQIGGNWFMKDLEAVAAFTDGKMTAAAAVQAGDEAKTKAIEELHASLGEAGFAKYEECERSYPARSLLEQFDKQQGFFAIHELQRQRLSDLLAAQPPGIASALVGDWTVSDLVSPDGPSRLLEQEAAVNQQILQGAAAFLEPEQVQALGLMQTNNLSTQRRDFLRMMRKL